MVEDRVHFVVNQAWSQGTLQGGLRGQEGARSHHPSHACDFQPQPLCISQLLHSQPQVHLNTNPHTLDLGGHVSDLAISLQSFAFYTYLISSSVVPVGTSNLIKR